MSSPIAKSGKSALDRALIAGHQKMSHGRRIRLLAADFSRRIEILVGATREEELRILDVGCGDMSLVDALSAHLEHTLVRCVDVHPCPPERLAQDARWHRYTMFDGRHLEFEADSFDVVLLSDVLHHVSPSDRLELLTEAGRVGRWVLVKDHLEQGWLSRQVLRAMDFVGNYGYGVPVPGRYFDRPELESLVRSAGMQAVQFDVGLDLYAHLPVVRTLLSPEWQVVVVATRPTN